MATPMAFRHGNVVLSSSSSPSPDAQQRAKGKKVTRRQKFTRERESESPNSLLQQIKAYWSSLDSEKRENFFEISISDLKRHFAHSAHHENLTRYLFSVEKQQSLTVMCCCECGEEFLDSDSFLNHLRVNHVQIPQSEQGNILSKEVDKDIEEFIVSGDWLPLDRESTETTHEEDNQELRDQEKKQLSPYLARTKNLKTIQQNFLSLLKRGSLSASLLKRVMKFATNEVRGHALPYELPGHKINPLSHICLLNESQLSRISTFLKVVIESCKCLEDTKSLADDIIEEESSFPMTDYIRYSSPHFRINASYFQHTMSSQSNDAIISSLFSEWNFDEELEGLTVREIVKVSHGQRLLQLIAEDIKKLHGASESNSGENSKSVIDEAPLKLSYTDLQIMQFLSTKLAHEHKLVATLSFNRGFHIMPFIKAFMRSKLEVLAAKHAAQKAEEADATLEDSINDLVFEEKNKNNDSTEAKSKKKKNRRRAKSKGKKVPKEDSPEEAEMEYYMIVETASRRRKVEVPSRVLSDEPDDQTEAESWVEIQRRTKLKPSQQQKQKPEKSSVDKQIQKFGFKAESPTDVQKNVRMENQAEFSLLGDNLKFRSCGSDGRAWGKHSGDSHSAIQTTAKHGKDKNFLGSNDNNEVKDYASFVDAVSQALLLLSQFELQLQLQETLLEHSHKGNLCIVCAFASLKLPPFEDKRDVVLRRLKTVVGNLFPDDDSFREVKDVSKTLYEIFEALHKSFTGEEDQKTISCQRISCAVHRCFAMDILGKMHCSNCGEKSGPRMYTSFFHRIDMHNLSMIKNSFSCEAEAEGYRMPNHLSRMISGAPKVFTLVLDWQSTYGNEDHRSAALDWLTTEVDVAKFFDGLEGGKKHSLVCMLCHSAQHYVCIAYHHQSREWVVHDDGKISVIGQWKDIVSACKRGLQLLVLFFGELE